MKNKNTIILFALSILFFSLSLIGVYVYGQTTPVYHPASEITAGTFQAGTYAFGDGSSVSFSKPGDSTGTVAITSPVGFPGIIFRSNDPETYRADILRTKDALVFKAGAVTSAPSDILYLNNDKSVVAAGNVFGSNFSTAGSVTGSIFYDNDSTDYFVDSNSTSLLRHLYVGAPTSYTARHNTYLTVNRGAPDRGVLRFSTTGSVEWNLGILYDCGTNNNSFNISQTDWRRDCTNTYYPEVEISKTAGMFLRPRDGNVYIRTADNGDNGSLQARNVYTTHIMNGTNVPPNISGAGVGDIKIVADTSTGNDIYMRGNGGGDSANLHVYRIYVTQICLGGVCKTAW